MKVYGYLHSVDEAVQIFSHCHTPERQQSKLWAGVYVHWRDGYILIVGEKRPELAPYPYEDAVLHCELYPNASNVHM